MAPLWVGNPEFRLKQYTSFAYSEDLRAIRNISLSFLLYSPSEVDNLARKETDTSICFTHFDYFQVSSSKMARRRKQYAYWKADVDIEQSKLAAKETDWNLAGIATAIPLTQTRHGGSGRPSLNKRFHDELQSDSGNEEVGED
jgi:hypothetical protein